MSPLNDELQYEPVLVEISFKRRREDERTLEFVNFDTIQTISAKPCLLPTDTCAD